ncbi:MAG: hypothetical protein F4Z91_07715, partial [Acidimicrobiia bacterium]|nr:hypothetical protein [Acidimicrobiia bacterium]
TSPAEAQSSRVRVTPTISHSNGSTTVHEGGATDTFTVTVNRPSAGCNGIQFFAGSGLQIRRANTSSSFGLRVNVSACSANNTYSIEVQAVDDSWDVPGIWRHPGKTGNEYSSTVRIFEVNAGANKSSIINPVSVPVTIVDNDPPMVNLSGGAAVTEGNPATFTITATSPPTSAVTVQYRVRQNNPYIIFPGDFVAATELGIKTVQLPAGALSATFEVPTVADTTDEADGSVRVHLLYSRPSAGYTVVAPAYQEVVVLDDDDADSESNDDSVSESNNGDSEVPKSNDDNSESDGAPVDGDQPSQIVVVNDDTPQVCETADELATKARANHDALSNTWQNKKKRNNWWRAWIALSGKTGTYNTPLTAAEAQVLESSDARWTPFRQALECVEGTSSPADLPEVSVTAGAGITEGETASFTITASPAPSAPLSVDVTVAQTGDYGATTGTQTTTIGTDGTATITVTTNDDDTDETNGSINITINPGNNYTISTTEGSANLTVADNDDPPPADLPEVSISDASITEGELGWLSPLEFRLTLNKASDQDITVHYQIRLGTAINGSDYWGGSQATISAGRTHGNIVVIVVDDKLREGNENLKIELTDADGAVIDDGASIAVGTIIDND